MNKISLEADDILKKDIDLNNAGADKLAADAASTYGFAFMLLAAILGLAVVVGGAGAEVPHRGENTRQVSANVTDVQRGASDTGSASSRVLSAAQMLSADSGRLKIEVSKFLASVRAA